MSDTPPIDTPEYAEAVARADAALQRRSAVISGHRIGPRLVWTLQPMNYSQIVDLVEGGGGMGPLRVLNVMQAPRECLRWEGAPGFAMYAYLVNCEIRATFAESQR